MTVPSTPETPSIFANLRFIMVQPSHPGNVGAAARAIKTMGFRQLVLVAPRYPDVLEQAEAQALASGATDVLASAHVAPTLGQALKGVTLAFALTARPRDLGPPVCDIRQAATAAREHLHLHPAGQVAVVLGTERSGLTNDDIALCQKVCHIPANPDYNSLNVAQALQLAAWELRYALAGETGVPMLPLTGKQAEPPGQEPASSEKVQDFLTHWEQTLIAIEFLNPRHPKKLMPRMRHLFARNSLTNDEVNMLRGVCTAMMETALRARSSRHDPPEQY